MISNSIHLDKTCQICGSTNYNEDESGFYTCSTCGCVSDIRCFIELDYESFGKLAKVKSKNINHNNSDDDEIENENLDNLSNDSDSFDKDTNFKTNLTRNNSSINNDNYSSTFSRKSSRNKIIKVEKSLNEILLDSQNTYQNIFICLSKEYLKNISDDIKKEFIDNSKKIWLNYISKEYDIQSIYGTSTGRERNPNLKNFVRSRQNTMDENDIKNNVLNQNNEIKKNLKKKQTIYDIVKCRKIKSKNVMNSYKISLERKKKIPNRELIRQFSEEYEAVIKFIKEDENIKNKSKEYNLDINSINETISYQNLIKVSNILNINLSIDYTFEDLIHKIFVSQSLNYQTTISFPFDKQKTTLNSDYFLFLLYQSFNNNLKLNIPLLNSDLLVKVRNFDYISQLSLNDLIFFKFSNYGKYIKLINQYDKNNIEFFVIKGNKIIEYIVLKLLKLTYDFLVFCQKILIKLKDEYISFLKSKYILEQICIGIIIYALKIFYGINDLPYISLLIKNIDMHNIKELNEVFTIYEENSKNDILCLIYKSLPSLNEIIQNLTKIIENDINNQVIYLRVDNKKNYSKEYKEKLCNIYSKEIFKDLNINYSERNINELKDKFIQENKENKKNKKQIKINLNINQKFQLKKKQKKEKIKEFGLTHFLKEEISYYKYNQIENEKDYEIPLPCDTIINYKRQAMKFSNVEPKTTEVVLMYLFCRYFKIDYSSINAIVKFTEKNLEKE